MHDSLSGFNWHVHLANCIRLQAFPAASGSGDRASITAAAAHCTYVLARARSCDSSALRFTPDPVQRNFYCMPPDAQLEHASSRQSMHQ